MTVLSFSGAPPPAEDEPPFRDLDLDDFGLLSDTILRVRYRRL
jgi:hypothetical protein